MKIDLHVHTKHSNEPTQWVLKKLGCPESFMEPRQVYDVCRKKGMDLVTITDHNCIDGALEIAHLPGAFLSEEVTALFPEDRCKVHCLVWDINEAQHRELQRTRRNIYDFVAYVQAQKLNYALAHPLYAVNDKLTLDHLEKLLLLFSHFEMNGTRDGMQNNALRVILQSLTPEMMEQLADKHGIIPAFDEPWKKGVTGGSDDHSGLNIARSHTVVPGATDKQSFFAGLNRLESDGLGVHSTPQTMAHNLYSIGYQYYKEKFRLAQHVNKDHFLKFVDRFLTCESPDDRRLHIKLQALVHNSKILKKRRQKKSRESILALLRNEAQALVMEEATKANLQQTPDFDSGRAEEQWFGFVNRAVNGVLAHFADKALDSVTRANIFDIFQNVGAACGLYTVLFPYFIGYTLFTKDRAFTRRALNEFAPSAPMAPTGGIKKVHFTDTFFETNGVARTLQQQVRMAVASNKDYTVITCDPENRWDGPGVKNFQPIGISELPEYPEINLLYPPFLEMLDYVYTGEFTHIHSATPGPIGLSGLVISRILKLPLYGTYHTALPQYAGYLTGDEAMEELMWRFMVWFYNQMDRVYVPSHSTKEELIAKGILEEKIHTYPRGVDTDRFHPSKKNGFFDQYGLGQRLRLLYVGRVSKEKNLPVLEEAFRRLAATRKDIHLVVVGDGPYREEMERNLEGLPAVFTGKLEGEDLAQAYASCDLFVFPSTTDTFGNVVLEAQASGLPVVVTDQGGPRENMLPDETGLVVPGDDADAITRAVEALVADPARLEAMSRRARNAMEDRSFQKAFDTTWSLYT